MEELPEYYQVRERKNEVLVMSWWWCFWLVAGGFVWVMAIKGCYHTFCCGG